MGLEQQLEAFKQEFLRTAPAGRPALYEAKIDASFEPASHGKRQLGLEPFPLISGCLM